MLLRALSQLNYRNLRPPRVEFGPGINAVVGANAAGKSNLLEAVYLGCSGELPGGKIAETLRIGTDEGFVGIRLEHQDGPRQIDIGLAPGRKVIRLDGQTVRALDLARVSAAVLITPEDADLIHGSPSGRRQYLDSLIGRVSPRYAVLSKEYARVLEQRNAILKRAPSDPSLSVWSERFAELGNEIASLRRRALVRIADIAANSYRDISGGDKTFGVALQHEDVDLRDALDATYTEERARGVTVVGPHRDDLGLTLDGHSVQAYGSRGEARTASLALRVAEYRLLRDKHGEAPVLLIDDFTAELDAGRRDYLLALAEETPQALVSGTEPPPRAAQRLMIDEGDVRVETTAKRL